MVGLVVVQAVDQREVVETGHWAVRRKGWIGEGASRRSWITASFGSSIDQSISRWVLRDCVINLFSFSRWVDSYEKYLSALTRQPERKERDLTNWQMGSCNEKEKFLVWCTGIGAAFWAHLHSQLVWLGATGIGGWGLCWCWCNCTIQLWKEGD